MSKVYSAIVIACDSGFVSAEGPEEVVAAETIEDYLAWLADADTAVEPAPELDGRTQNQNGGKPYKFVDGDYTAYFMVWQED